MQKALKIGGFVAGVVLIVFGIVAIVLGAWGGHTVNKNLKNEFIVGTPDMTPSGIQPEIDAIKAQQQKIAAAQKQAKIPPAQQTTFTTVEAPSCSVAGEAVDNGSRAACFGNYMRIHALGSSNGLTYAQMGQYAAKPDAPVQFTDFNGGTSDTTYAQVDPSDGPTGLERCTERVGDGDIVVHVPVPCLGRHGHLAVRDRRRHRSAVERRRLPDPRRKWCDPARPLHERQDRFRDAGRPRLRERVAAGSVALRAKARSSSSGVSWIHGGGGREEVWWLLDADLARNRSDGLVETVDCLPRPPRPRFPARLAVRVARLLRRAELIRVGAEHAAVAFERP